MSKKEFACKIWTDVARCVMIGLALSVVTGIIGAILGQFLYNLSVVPVPAVQGAISALLIAGSVSMLLSAFFFAVRKKEAKAVSENWKRKFRYFRYPAVFLTVSVTVLIIGSLFDLLYFSLL